MKNKKKKIFLIILTTICTAAAYTQDFPGQEQMEIQPFFEELYRENEDIVGWLNTGTGIDLPVMQLDNDFYLHHDFYKNEKYAGTLFVNQINYLWPRDKVLFIHGHNMRDGSMFGSLMLYEDPEYVSRNPLVMFRTLYDPEEVYYTPVYAFNASMNEDNPDYFNLNWIYLGEAESPFEPEPEITETEQESGFNQFNYSQGDTDTIQSITEYQEETSTGQSITGQKETGTGQSITGQEETDTAQSVNYQDVTGTSQFDMIQDAANAQQSVAVPDEEEISQQFDTFQDLADTQQSVTAPDEEEISQTNTGTVNLEIESEEYKIITEADIAVDPQRYQTYLDAMAKISIWRTSMDVTPQDDLICLITCSYYQDNGRFVLVCRKLRKEETPESASEQFEVIL